MILLYFFIAIFIFLQILKVFFTKPSCRISVYFAPPRTGKTTIAAWLARRDMKQGRKVYSNVPIKGCLKVDLKDDIGKVNISNGRLIIDEAGVDYNNREVMNRSKGEKFMNKDAIKFFKYHGHFKVDIDIFSQSYEDFDVTLRRLATDYYIIKKSVFLPFFVKRQRILKKIKIDKETHQLTEMYYYQLFGTRYFFCPPLWKMFDSYNTYELPEKEFDKF